MNNKITQYHIRKPNISMKIGSVIAIIGGSILMLIGLIFSRLGT